MRKTHLICIDSDGCAIDSMTIKHRRCFATALIEIWDLYGVEVEVRKVWDDINLFSDTRGINRFAGLSLCFEKMHIEMECTIDGHDKLAHWVRRAEELSESRLCLEQDKHPIFRKALEWSKSVNEKAEALPVFEAFDGVKSFLDKASKQCDIVVVSSANEAGIVREWTYNGLIDKVTRIMSQKDGSKKTCMETLLGDGYKREKSLMIGDAPSDYKAAKEVGLLFYPIEVGKEKESFEKLKDHVLDAFVEGKAFF